MPRPTACGEWTIIERIAEGGNGVVWKATGPRGDAAVKILKRGGPVAYRRFRDEIAVLKALAGVRGVLPIWDSSLPDHPRPAEPSWIAMPLAVPIETALREQPIEAAVTAVRDIAQTLATLHAKEIYHRDVKPGNLYRYGDEWVVGDFGLVEFPGKESLTRSDRKLGPANFHAPEMLRSPDTAAAGPADVFSLAKTLWALVARQPWPPPGHLRADDGAANLDPFAEHARLFQLNNLIERATRLDPALRPTMADVAADLDAWLRPIAISSDSQDLSDLQATFQPLLGGIELERAYKQRHDDAARELSQRIAPELEKIEAMLRTVPVNFLRGQNMDVDQLIRVAGAVHVVDYHSDVIVPLRDRVLVGTIALQIAADDALHLFGVLIVTRHGAPGQPERLFEWLDHRTLSLGSLQEDHLIAELGLALQSRMREAVVVLLADA